MIDGLQEGSHPSITPVLKHFEEILKIPRPSGKEDQIRAYLERFASERGLRCDRDEKGNLIMAVGATPGHEGKPVIVLQAHMDMVCEGGNDVAPTRAVSDGAWIKSVGTTLGADNGIGLSMALAAAEDTSIAHGPFYILATVEEETGLDGATALDPKILPKADMIINLDSEDGLQKIFAGCAGGARIKGSLEVGNRSAVPAGYVTMQVTLDGLKGGHSGADIHLGRGNANKLLASVLRVLTRDYPEIQLGSFSGGEKTNAIPKSSQTQIAVPAELADKVTSFFESQGRNLAIGFPGLRLDTITLQDPVPVLQEGVWDKILATLCELPDGPLETEPDHPDRVLLSSNAGVVRITEQELSIAVLPRAARLQQLNSLVQQLTTIMQSNGFKAEVLSSHGPWEEGEGSAAVRLVIETIQQVTGVAPAAVSDHAGLECGEVKKAFGPDAPSSVSIGPLIKDAHMLSERVHLPSVVEVFEILLKILEKAAA